jgi:C4-dicarboxylate transporter DctQ subunit
LIRILDYLEELIITVLMACATLITFIAVVHRYLASTSWLPSGAIQDWLIALNMSWAQELTIIMFVWMAKFGAAYGVRTGIHVGVDLMINLLDESKRRFFVVFGLMAGALFTGIVGYLGAYLVWETGAHYAWLSWTGQNTSGVPEGTVTPDLEWPTWIVYLAVPLGSWLMCLRFLQVNWVFLRSGVLPHHDHSASVFEDLQSQKPENEKQPQ